jgi:hypothetical protein
MACCAHALYGDQASGGSLRRHADACGGSARRGLCERPAALVRWPSKAALDRPAGSNGGTAWNSRSSWPDDKRHNGRPGQLTRQPLNRQAVRSRHRVLPTVRGDADRLRSSCVRLCSAGALRPMSANPGRSPKRARGALSLSLATRRSCRRRDLTFRPFGPPAHLGGMERSVNLAVGLRRGRPSSRGIR